MALLEDVTNHVSNRGDAQLKICSGKSIIHQLRLYKKPGFKVGNVIQGYLLEKYPDPTFEISAANVKI